MWYGMQYCADTACTGSKQFFLDDDRVCSKCGKELTPCIECLCGEYEINPHWLSSVACPKCGERFTDAYLGRCMSAQLRGMLTEAQRKMSALN